VSLRTSAFCEWSSLPKHGFSCSRRDCFGQRTPSQWQP